MLKRRKITRKLTQSGCKTWYVTLPPKIINRFGWTKGENIEIVADREKQEIILRISR